MICWIGLYPSTSRSRLYGFHYEWISTYIDAWFDNVMIGPTALLVSTCVSAKNRNTGISLFSKLIAAWAVTFYLSFLSRHLAFVSDIFYISLALYGIFRTLIHSFITALAMAPGIAVVLVDLSIHERS